MVHGNYYGAQYEIYLKNTVDFYNDILPIWMSVRERIEYELVKFGNGQYKLIVIPYVKLDKRFGILENTSNYISAIDKLSHNSRLTRENKFEEFKYYDVKIYKDLIKHNKNLPKPISDEEFESLEESYETIKRKCISDDFWSKYSEKERIEFENERISLNDKLNIQRIISKPEYCEEIVRIEKSLTDIELTDREKELIDAVVNHPKLNGNIDYYGINLIEGYY